MGRGLRAVVIAGLVAISAVAHAQPKPGEIPLIGAQPLLTVAAPTGFIDDVAAVDGDRVAYVITDGTNAAALHIARVGGKPEEEQVIDISTFTLKPTSLTFVAGQRIFVVGAGDADKQVAALIELVTTSKKRVAGSSVYRIAPAEHIGVIARDGKLRVAVHRQVENTGTTMHTVEVLALETGRRVAAGKPLVVDGTGHDKKRDFRVNHWSDGWTKVHGVKAGEWDKKEDQKAPDQEATLDLVTGKIDRKPVDDLFEQKRRFGALADAAGKLDFLRMPPNGSGIELWRAGKMTQLTLDQKLSDYDPKSIQGTVSSDGSGWLALKVDPVNAEAVARKRADLEYLDIFRIAADGKATRKARLLAKGVRHRFGSAGESRYWLMDRNAGFERGGKTFTLYQLQ